MEYQEQFHRIVKNTIREITDLSDEDVPGGTHGLGGRGAERNAHDERDLPDHGLHHAQVVENRDGRAEEHHHRENLDREYNILVKRVLFIHHT
jgi:hypothetical protein